MANKRKATEEHPQPCSSLAIKRANTSGNAQSQKSKQFYPREMSNGRCAMYNNDELPRPLTVLEETLRQTNEERLKLPAGRSVVHWFKRDLRMSDNRSLNLASKAAVTYDIPLICVFIISPEDYEAHLTSACRVDFELRTLHILKQALAEKNIPLFVKTVETRREVPASIVSLCEAWGSKHVFCNIEYEVDELRREERLVRLGLQKGIAFETVHDDVLVPPGRLTNGSGKQYSVYSPWYRSWVSHLHSHPDLLEDYAAPAMNSHKARDTLSDLFEAPVPATPKTKRLTLEEEQKFSSLWPAGEYEAQARLQNFLDEKVREYKDTRSFPAHGTTAVLSVHLACGTISARTCIRQARVMNGGRALDGGNDGIKTWIAELGWRDFYKHVLAHWPYVCMAKPFKYEYSNIHWEHNDEHFAAWTRGTTGFPIVDAAMRQMKATGWMHNRCRMIVASFLAKDLLLDWRKGEKFFMESLVDGDFASNNGGWGFSASCGVDPQPYFRIFNPLLQSEKFDAEGEYIRKWVPELRNIEGKAIHDPYGRGAGKLAAEEGYPKPIIIHKEARERCLQRYKEGIGRDTA